MVFKTYTSLQICENQCTPITLKRQFVRMSPTLLLVLFEEPVQVLVEGADEVVEPQL